jgi:hypothetical protein
LEQKENEKNLSPPQNLKENPWEQIGNLLEQRENEKNLPLSAPSSPQNLKEKNKTP